MSRITLDDEAIVAEYRAGASLNALAREHGCSMTAIRRRVARAGEVRDGSAAKRLMDTQRLDGTWEALEDAILGGEGICEALEGLHVSHETAKRLAAEHGTSLSELRAQAQRVADARRDDEVRAMVAAGTPRAEMARRLGCSVSTVGRTITRLGIGTPTNRTDVTCEAVRDLLDQGLSANECAIRLNTSHSTIERRMAEMGIEPRERGTAIEARFSRENEAQWPRLHELLSHGVSVRRAAHEVDMDYGTASGLAASHGFGDWDPERVQARLDAWDGTDQGLAHAIREAIEADGAVPSTSRLAQRMGTTRREVRVRAERAGLADCVRFPRLSDGAVEIIERLEAEGVPYELNDRSHLAHEGSSRCLEMDVWLPEERVGLEVNPIWTHSVDTPLGVRDRKYHQAKALAAEEARIGLFHLWEDDLTGDRLDMVMGIVLAGRRPHVRVGARELAAVEPDAAQARAFLARWHLQGPATGMTRVVGLADREGLVSFMGLGRPRFGQDGDVELVRYCVRPDVWVTGGFARLLALSCRGLSGTLVTYRSLDKSMGVPDVYARHDFTDQGVTEPGYRWMPMGEGEPVSRYQATKAELVRRGWGSEDETEIQIMRRHGYVRVFDAGSRRYSWQIR